jgi:hypothetical protein
MTVTEARTPESEPTIEELVLFLSAPDSRDPAQITDPVATVGTRPPEPGGGAQRSERV